MSLFNFKRLQKLRKKKKLTQAQLAQASGVTQETISKAERGVTQPETETLVRIANVLEVGMDDLLSLEALND